MANDFASLLAEGLLRYRTEDYEESIKIYNALVRNLQEDMISRANNATMDGGDVMTEDDHDSTKINVILFRALYHRSEAYLALSKYKNAYTDVTAARALYPHFDNGADFATSEYGLLPSEIESARDLVKRIFTGSLGLDNHVHLCNLQILKATHILENTQEPVKFVPGLQGVTTSAELQLVNTHDDLSVMTPDTCFRSIGSGSTRTIETKKTTSQRSRLVANDEETPPPAGKVKTAAATAVTLLGGGWPWPAITEDDNDNDDDDSLPDFHTSLLSMDLTLRAAVARSMAETTNEDTPPTTSNLMDFEVYKGDSMMKKVTKQTNTTVSDDKPPSKRMEVISLSFPPPPTYKVWVLPPAVIDGVEQSYSNNSINLGMYLRDDSIEFPFDLLSDNPVHVAQEMAKELDEVPYDDVGEICTAINDAVQEARMKLSQGMLAYEAAVYDANLAIKLGEASGTKNQINPTSTFSDQGNLASNRLPSFLAEQGGRDCDIDIRSCLGRAVHPPAEDNALNGVPNYAVLKNRTAISDAAREARMDQNPWTIMQQSTFDTILAGQLQFIEDAGILAANVDIHTCARRAVDPPAEDNARVVTEVKGVAIRVPVATLVEDEEIYLATCVTPPEPNHPWWNRCRSILFRRKAA